MSNKLNNNLLKELTIYKWNIYVAKVPYTDDFSKSKERPVVVVGINYDDYIILRISSQLNKRQQTDFDIKLDMPSLIKVANIQSIHKKDFIAPYYRKGTQQVIKVPKDIRKKINLTIAKITK